MSAIHLDVNYSVTHRFRPLICHLNSFIESDCCIYLQEVGSRDDSVLKLAF